MIEKKYKTICPLPWLHIGANSNGSGNICCYAGDGEKYYLKDNTGKLLLWKNFKNIQEYYNSENYKQIRQEMLNDQRPVKCAYCFDQEDHGVQSIRKQFLRKYRDDMSELIANTNADGSIDNPQISFLDMEMGNKCNLKCRMCSPIHSYALGKDWELMDRSFKNDEFEKIYKDKWYASPQFFSLLREVLPSLKVLRMTGGEPMLIKEHEQILEMIIEAGHSDHIWLKYNSNQTVIPQKILNLWKYFQQVDFNCSIEAYGKLNDYIRYPSKWKNQEKNMHILDEFSYENKSVSIFIHSTLQAYNITRVPEFLNYLCSTKFKSIFRFPYFIWNKIPEWLSPCIYPQSFRNRIADRILNSLDKHEDFFFSYNKEAHKEKFHKDWTYKRINHLRGFCEMIRNESEQERFFKKFIQETKKYDKLRNQSVTKVLPELKQFFN
ncbi:MAG: twitch domain-containing radical SAM protein [Oligoflexia bacterium]|nr:twitch domain-containing radical SAM protein [Oligoflexia bacterium]